LAHAEDSKIPLPKVSGFLMPIYKWTNAPEGDDASADKGYSLKDAALYFSHDYKKVHVFVDLAFRSQTTTTASGEPNNSFGFAKYSSQAFVNYKFTDSLEVTFGQFDTLLGFESNDGKDRFFIEGGLASNQALNTTETGAMLGYTLGDFKIQLVNANQNNETAGYQNKASESIVFLTYTKDWFHASSGFLTYKEPTTNKSFNIIEGVAGVDLGKLKVDVEFDSKKDPTQHIHSQFYSLFSTYQLFDKFTLGLREEYAHNASSKKSQVQHTLGFQYDESEVLSLKASYTFNHSAKDMQKTGRTNTQTVLAGLVYKF